MKKDNVRLGIVCPMANEKSSAIRFIKDVLNRCTGFKSVTFYTILDKACTDGTHEILMRFESKEPRLNVIWAPENKCVVDAYIRGYREAVSDGCDWILEIDAGYSHQPEDIPQFFYKMAEGYECVFGSRFCKGGDISLVPIKRRFISRGGTILANLFLGTKLMDMTSGFEMFTKSALKTVIDRGIRSKGHFFQTEIKVYCRKLRITEVPIKYCYPSSSVTKAALWDAIVNLFYLSKLRLLGRL